MTNRTYEGKEPYIFISYAHKDSQRVLPIIEGLQNRGFRVWYDAGIEAGTEWPEYIAEHLMHAECVIAFISENSLASPNCRQEIFFAMDERKSILVVYLDDIVVSPGIRMRLGPLQALYRYRHPTEESFLETLAGAKILQSCLAVSKLPDSEKLPMDSKDASVSADEALSLATKAFIRDQFEEMFHWYRVAAECGNVQGMIQLAWCYRYGHGVRSDLNEAILWYKAAAEKGDCSAMFQIGDCYERQLNQPRNAFTWYLAAAEEGDIAAILCLARCFRTGYGTTRDLNASIFWYRKAADSGNLEAQFQLGTCYEEIEDMDSAAHWYQIAAEIGHAEAMYRFGECLYHGFGIEEDLDEAFNWFLDSADRGVAAAMFRLGSCYHYGTGVAKDPVQAAYWYQQAAEKGFIKAFCRLAWCYEAGLGVTRNLEEATRLYRRAAEQGSTDAQQALRRLGQKF